MSENLSKNKNYVCGDCLLKEHNATLLKREIAKLKDILINEYGACPECIEAWTTGFTICGDCYAG